MLIIRGIKVNHINIFCRTTGCKDKKGSSSSTFITTVNINSNKLLEPSSGIYHAAFPDFGGTEDIVITKKIIDFETLVGKNIVWHISQITGIIINFQQKKLTQYIPKG